MCSSDLLGRTLLRLVPLAIGIWWLTSPLANWLQVLIRGGIMSVLGSFLVLRYGVAGELQDEFVQRLPPSLAGWAGRLFGRSA